jgi:hypothetical protein
VYASLHIYSAQKQVSKEVLDNDQINFSRGSSES